MVHYKTPKTKSREQANSDASAFPANRLISPTAPVYDIVFQLQNEVAMLRECNEQLVVSEQSIRNECNNLRRGLRRG